MERQIGNKTYIVGGYKPIVCDFINLEGHYQKEKIRNIIVDLLEKDIYYYDCYETNYLYYNDNMINEQGKLKEKIKSLNDYSINKIKNNNYFSYSSLCINAFNKKGIINNEINELKNKDMQKENFYNNISNKKAIKRLKKEELLNKITNMEIEYNNEKNINDNFYSTMKVINGANYNYYKLAKFEPSLIPIKNLIDYFLLNYIFCIKDLAYIQKMVYTKIEKSDEKSTQEKKNEKKLKLSPFNREIENIYDKLIKRMKETDLGDSEKVIKVLFENAKETIERLIYK